MIDVFLARRIITMNPSWPDATAVAVRDGQILEVGSLESLQPCLATDQYRLREDFADQVMLPGFIDPHLHPIMAAVLLPMHFITALEWRYLQPPMPLPIGRRWRKATRRALRVKLFLPGVITPAGTVT